MDFNLNSFDSPSLIILKEKVEANINKMIAIAGGVPSRLMPHIKTNKMENVVKMMLEKGIQRFKSATIAEAELAAMAGAKAVLIAHQLVGPKINRLIELIKKYPNTQFASLVDCPESCDYTSEVFQKENLIANVYYDINNGMNRSGHELNENLKIDIEYAMASANLNLMGFHVYDGHVRNSDFNDRKTIIEKGMQFVQAIFTELQTQNEQLELIAGGTPAFTSHASEEARILSPGTCVLWDWGYGDTFAEQNFEFAAMILTRVISKPQRGIVTIDLGHKAVSSENPIDFRIRFVDNPDIKLISQSEEHGVLEVKNWDDFRIGDQLLGIPYHICPSVNLYDEAYVIDKLGGVEIWKIEGRKRKISI